MELSLGVLFKVTFLGDLRATRIKPCASPYSQDRGKHFDALCDKKGVGVQGVDSSSLIPAFEMRSLCV